MPRTEVRRPKTVLSEPDIYVSLEGLAYISQPVFVGQCDIIESCFVYLHILLLQLVWSVDTHVLLGCDYYNTTRFNTHTIYTYRVFPSSYLHLRIRCKVFRAPQKNLIVFSSHNYQCCVYVLMWVLWMSCLPGSCFLFIISYICFHVGFDGSDLSSFVKFSELLIYVFFFLCAPLLTIGRSRSSIALPASSSPS
jgi:hypothetical protein